MANDREFIIQPLITEGKIVKLSEIDPNTAYAQIGVWQDNQRQSASSGNAYPSYVISLAELIAGAGGCPPITRWVIPQGTGPCINDGNWAFGDALFPPGTVPGPDLYPLKDCSNIGLPTNRVKTIYMCSTLDYLTDLTWVNAGNERMRITASGNVGIGIMPAQKLHVNGTFRIEDTMYIANDGFLTFSAGTNVSLMSTAGRYLSLRSTDQYIEFMTNGSERARILANGNFGIGTGLPTARVHIHGESSTAATYSLKVEDLANNPLFNVNDAGLVGINIALATMPLDVRSAFQNIANFKSTAVGTQGTVYIDGISGAQVRYLENGVDKFGMGWNSVTGFIHTNGDYFGISVNNGGGYPFIMKPTGVINLPNLQTGNVGLVSGDTYKDTAANILAAGDYIVAVKV